MATYRPLRDNHILVVPYAFAPAVAVSVRLPLVLVLHGHLGTAANALGSGISPSPLSAWLDIAAREKVLVVALQGLRGGDHRTGWHDCRNDAPENPQVDDVAFASAVVKKLVDEGRAHPHGRDRG